MDFRRMNQYITKREEFVEKDFRRMHYKNEKKIYIIIFGGG